MTVTLLGGVVAGLIIALVAVGIYAFGLKKRLHVERRTTTVATVAQTSVSGERDSLADALNASIDGILTLDRQGIITFANYAAAAIAERQPAELIGTPLTFLFPSEELKSAVDALNTGAERTLLLDHQNRHLMIVIVPAARGETTFVVIRDLTETYRLERARRDFVANVSHEMRTPVAALKAVIETLQDGAVHDEEATRDFLSRAEQEIDRMAQIIEELLELSRIESGDLPIVRAPVDMRDIAERAVERLRVQALRRRIDLGCDVPDQPAMLLGDAERLERVMLNLLHNAIKFTPEGGAITVRVEQGLDEVSVAVIDTGSGIAAAELPRIFERFYKADRARSQGGTGLGLAIVKHTIEAHGGSVSAESEPGAGSAFRLYLPSFSQ